MLTSTITTESNSQKVPPLSRNYSKWNKSKGNKKERRDKLNNRETRTRSTNNLLSTRSKELVDTVSMKSENKSQSELTINQSMTTMLRLSMLRMFLSDSHITLLKYFLT
jgi:hypothetical protein